MAKNEKENAAEDSGRPAEDKEAPGAEKAAKAEKSKKSSGEKKKPADDKKKGGADNKRAEGEGASAKAPPRLLVKYRQEVLPAMARRFGYKNVMQAPRLVKVTLNMGVGEGSRDVKIIEAAEADLAMIAGQKPRRTRARISVANFKIRKGMPIGCMVTLRGHRMWEFLDRLINVAVPRIRDFRGINPNAFDGRGNHSFGIREHTIFMELDLNKVAHVRGMNICTTTTARTDEEARELLRLLGMPFRA